MSGQQSRMEFLAVRARYIREMRAAGIAWNDMLEAINLIDGEHARLIDERDRTMGVDPIVVVDPIAFDDAGTPAELEKKQLFGASLAIHIQKACCPEHGSETARWHVGVEMRRPITERDRFFVVLDIDGTRCCDLGPMSADVANELLAFAESGIAKKLPGSERGSVSRLVYSPSEFAS